MPSPYTTDIMEQQIEELQKKYDALIEESEQLRKVLDESKKKILVEKSRNIESKIPYYTQRLERLKKYIEGFMSERRGRSVRYHFREVDEYTDDFHDPMHDPLDWQLVEYDLLDMQQYLHIIFDVSNNIVLDFVKKWMKENVFYADDEEYSSHIFEYMNAKTKESK